MLARTQLISHLAKRNHSLHPTETHAAYAVLRDTYLQCIAEGACGGAHVHAGQPWGHYPLMSVSHPYRVSGIDGSQIYPDRHEGIVCGLLQTAVVYFEYGECTSACTPDYALELVFPTDLPADIPLSTDTINILRTLAEYRHAAVYAQEHPHDLILFDGVVLTAHQAWYPPYLYAWIAHHVHAIQQIYATSQYPYMSYTERPRARHLVKELMRRAQIPPELCEDVEHDREFSDRTCKPFHAAHPAPGTGGAY